MPTKTQTPPRTLPSLPAGLLDLFDEEPKTAQEINDTVLALQKALIERALSDEMSHHLGYTPGAAKPDSVTNQRNGTGAKTVHTDRGSLRIDTPREQGRDLDVAMAGISGRPPRAVRPQRVSSLGYLVAACFRLGDR